MTSISHSPQEGRWRARIRDMPPPPAQCGDVFWVFRDVTRRPWTFGPKKSRPCCCVDADPPEEEVWTAIPRLTTGISKSDLRSAASPSIGLDRDGAWSLRFIHQVLKSKTGGDACRYLGTLDENERDCLVGLYEQRFREQRA